MNDWVPEERPVPEELTDEFDHSTFPPPATRWNTVADQLNEADRETLRLYAMGGTGNATWRDTEIGTE